jgi:hypothetical protein
VTIKTNGQPKTAEDIANELKAKSWNECVVPRLESIRAWFASSDWTEGLAPHYREAQSRFMDYLLQGNSTLTHEQEKFLLGELAQIREFLALPETILKNIMLRDRNQAEAEKRSKSVGKAGY